MSGSHGSLPTQKASLVSTCGAGAARAGRSGTGGGGGGGAAGAAHVDPWILRSEEKG